MKIIGYLSVIICFIFLIFNYLNIYLNVKLKRKRCMIIFLTLLLSIIVIAFMTKPYEGDDLTRYFMHIQNFRDQGINYYYTFPYKDNLLITILFYVISLTPYNNLISIISVITFYSVIFLLLHKFYKDCSSRYLSLFIVAFTSFVYINHIISGIRSPMAFAIFALILLYDNENRNISYSLLYIIPLMIHSSTIVFIGLILLMKIKKLSNINIEKWIFIIPYLCLLIAFVFPKNIPIVSDVFNRLLIYANPSYYVQFLDIRVQIIHLIMFGIILFLYKQNKDFRNSNKIYNHFYKLLIFLEIGLLPFPMIFGRFFTLLFVLSIPMFLFIEKLENKPRRFIIILILILSLGLFAYRMVNAYYYWRFY